jgi:hypothetical protein
MVSPGHSAGYVISATINNNFWDFGGSGLLRMPKWRLRAQIEAIQAIELLSRF